MYRTVTDNNGNVIGFEYTDAYGQVQFVPAVGMPPGFMQSSLPAMPPPPPPPPTSMGWLSSEGRDQYAPRTGPAPAAPAGQPGAGFGGSAQPGAGFGGPAAGAGANSPMASKYAGLNAKVRGNFTGIANDLRNTVTGQGTPSSYPTEADYARGDRLYNKDIRQNQRLMKDQQAAQAAFANPMFALNPGDLSRRDYSYYSSMPLTQLTFLTQGANGRDRWSDNSRKFENAVQGTARDVGSGMDYQQDTLMQNLFSPNRNSALGRSFQTLVPGEPRYDKNNIYKGTRRDTWDWAPATTQADVMRSYMTSIYNTTMDPNRRQSAMNYVNQLIDQWAARAYGDNNPGPLYRWLGNELGY